MKKVSIISIFSLTMGWLCSCSGSEEEIPPLTPPASVKLPISWQVKSAETVESKALIENNTALQDSCAGADKESIGIWGRCNITQNGQTFTHTDFDATPLTYGKKTEDTTNPHNDWNYPGEDRYWRSGGVYTFRACFPQTLMQDKMTEITPDIIQGPLNTATTQRDIMVATAYVNTLNSDLSKPVPLDMMHVFSALMFKIKAADGYPPPEGEGLTSCWLQNQSNDTDLFTTSGYFVFSGGWGVVTQRWDKYNATDAPMYRWEHEGVTFNSNTETPLYSENGNLAGNEYTQNDGWVLVVPQAVKENSLHFCYTLKNAGNQVFSVPIPAITYEAGKRYTYVLEISGASATVTLSIADWNKLDSSHDINF